MLQLREEFTFTLTSLFILFTELILNQFHVGGMAEYINMDKLKHNKHLRQSKESANACKILKKIKNEEMAFYVLSAAFKAC